jgi:membrane protease YdiL (CAAX protease family)
MVKKYISYVAHPERLKKFIDLLAYGSLVLDICITIITLSSIFYPLDFQKYLGSVNAVLSIVVILSIASALMIVGVRIYEELLFRTYKIRTHVKNHMYRLRKFDWVRKRFFDIYLWKKKIKAFLKIKY